MSDLQAELDAVRAELATLQSTRASWRRDVLDHAAQVTARLRRFVQMNGSHVLDPHDDAGWRAGCEKCELLKSVAP